MHPHVSTAVSTLDSTKKPLFSKIIPITALACFGSCLATAATQPVTLRWNANTETDLAGYKVQLGTRSGIYDQSFTVENGTSLTLPDLAPGTAYYSAVQAYNFAGQPSENSAEIQFASSPVIAPPVTLHWNSNTETDLGGYKIHIGTRSGVYDQIFTVTNSTSLAISELSPGTEYFCVVQAYNLAGLDSPFSQEISFNTTSGAPSSAMQQWLDSYGTSGDAAADPDGDGMNQLLEFAFGTDPTRPSSGLAGVSANGGVLRGNPSLTPEGALFCRRLDPAANGLSYHPQFSDDLNSWATSSALGSVLAEDSEVEVVLIPLPNADASRQFFRLEIQHTP